MLDGTSLLLKTPDESLGVLLSFSLLLEGQITAVTWNAFFFFKPGLAEFPPPPKCVHSLTGGII